MNADGPTRPGSGGGKSPASYVVGVGATSRAEPAELERLVGRTLADADIDPGAVRMLATIESRVDHPAITALPWPVVGYSAENLNGVSAADPSARVATDAGTTSVAEAAALLAAGQGAQLVVPKQRSAHTTCAVARHLEERP